MLDPQTPSTSDKKKKFLNEEIHIFPFKARFYFIFITVFIVNLIGWKQILYFNLDCFTTNSSIWNYH